MLVNECVFEVYLWTCYNQHDDVFGCKMKTCDLWMRGFVRVYMRVVKWWHILSQMKVNMFCVSTLWSLNVPDWKCQCKKSEWKLDVQCGNEIQCMITYDVYIRCEIWWVRLSVHKSISYMLPDMWTLLSACESTYGYTVQ